MLSGLLIGSLELTASASGHEQNFGHYGGVALDLTASNISSGWCFAWDAHSPEEVSAKLASRGCSLNDAYYGQGWLAVYGVNRTWAYGFGITRESAIASALSTCRTSEPPGECILISVLHTSDGMDYIFDPNYFEYGPTGTGNSRYPDSQRIHQAPGSNDIPLPCLFNQPSCR